MEITEIIFEESPWFIMLCIFTGVFYAFTLYQKKNDWSKRVNYALATLRFLLVSLICLLLLVPLVKQTRNLIEKPTIVFAIDNSESMILKDSLQVFESIIDLENAKLELEKKGYAIDVVTFDDSKPLLGGIKFDSKQTNLSYLLKNVNNEYENRNLISTILISDGINNKGFSPEHLNLNFEINTIGIGDTSFVQDLFVKNIYVNKIAYKGNKFPLKVEVGNRGFEGIQQKVVLKQNGKKVAEKQLICNFGIGTQEVSFLVEATMLGKQQFTAEILPNENEFNSKNNSCDVYIDIVDGKQKILLLASGPHPDIKAIQNVIDGQKNYDLNIKIGDELNKPVEGKYDLVIYHQIPNINKQGNKLLSKFKNESNWFLTGSQSDYKELNKIQNGVKFSLIGKQTDNVFASYNSNNDKFKFEKENTSIVMDYPPIVVPFGDITMSKSTSAILKQRVGSVVTEKPLLCVSEKGNVKNLFFIGEGLWKWRMTEYAKNENHNAFDKLISNSIQYSATTSDKRKLRVSPLSNEFLADQNVQLDVEVYNDVFEKIYDKEIQITLTNIDYSSEYKFVNSVSKERFSLGNLAKGVYSYTAKVEVNGKPELANGSFVVIEQNMESLRTTADFYLMNRIAENNNGDFYLHNELNILIKKMLGEDHPDKIISSYEELNELINQKWLFFVLLLLVVIEWGSRKYFGSL